MSEENHACEECGLPATCHVADQREVEPEKADDGSLYARYEPTERHHFCDDHARPARKIYRTVT